MPITDYPVKTKDSDRLNRASMAKHIARLVNDFESKESFVVGIEGEWGSGKSSFINFIIEEINKEKAEVVFFNPWNFSSQDQLIEDFFDSLLSAVEKVDPKTSLKDRIKKYKRKLKNVDFNPSAYGISIFNAKIDLTSLNSLRSDLENDLEKLSKKIMIVIDDLDRLDTAETLSIFKLVKITANFPNCIFFLAYDRGRVIKRIDEATNKAGDDYLKKIIQTTFRLPTINRKQLSQMVFEHINISLADLFGDIKLNDDDQKRWDLIAYHGFTDLFQNIRDLKRYASSLELNFNIIGKHEVNVVDFLVLEAIRSLAPDFYDEIPKNRWLFTKKFYGLSYTQDKDKRPDAYKEITERTLGNNPQKEKILSIVKELFPQIDFHGNYGNDWEEIWTGEKRVCSDSKFEIYFHLSVPSDEISEEEFEGMMEQVNKQELIESISVFTKLNSESKLRNFLKKIHDRFNKDYENHSKFFMNVNDGLFSIFGYSGMAEYDPLDFDGITRQLYRLVWRISEKISGEEEKYTFLKSTLLKNKLLYQRVDLLRVLKREKTGQADHLRDIKIALEKSVQDILPELQKTIDEDTLKNEVWANHILWAYKEWGKEEEIKKYVKKLVENEEDIFIVLNWLKTKVNSSNRGVYYSINKETITGFVDISIVDDTFNKLDREKLLDNQKELYDLYKKTDEERW